MKSPDSRYPPQFIREISATESRQGLDSALKKRKGPLFLWSRKTGLAVSLLKIIAGDFFFKKKNMIVLHRQPVGTAKIVVLSCESLIQKVSIVRDDTRLGFSVQLTNHQIFRRGLSIGNTGKVFQIPRGMTVTGLQLSCPSSINREVPSKEHEEGFVVYSKDGLSSSCSSGLRGEICLVLAWPGARAKP